MAGDALSQIERLAPDDEVLTDEQRRRIQCLRAAREVLVSRGFGPAGKADPIELIDVARYIESGEDPYAVPPKDRMHPASPLPGPPWVWKSGSSNTRGDQ